jgi:uncharacterized protein with ParB-like and HNH nuclease domain
VIIKPVDRRIRNLFQDSFYRIPRFQRPYSWTREQLEEFWEDAILSDEKDYFIGSMVVFEESDKDNVFNVVDGQQRLTTVTLLLAAVRDAFDAADDIDSAKGVQRIIERPDLDNKDQFTLSSETPYPYLQEHIQKHGEPDVTPELGEEEKRLKFAFEYFQDRVGKAVQAIQIDTTIADDDKPKLVVAKLQDIRNRVLRLIVIVVTLADEDDAYLIFETLNSRGMDLGVSDLVKNHLTRLLKPKNKGVDTAKDQYLAILALFDESEARISMNTFLHHSWLSREEYVSQKKLFKSIKKRVKTKRAAKEYLDAIVADSKLYRALLEPKYRKWSKEEQPLLESIEAIRLFGVAQSRPLVLALFRAYDNGVVKLKFVRSAMRQLESYHFVFTAITGQRAGGGFAMMYASDARSVTGVDDSQEAATKWAAILRKLREKIPPLDEFEASFGQLQYLNTATKDRRLVRYILGRISIQGSKLTLSARDHWTIEHLASQNPPAGGHGLADDVVGSIGNLLLVPEELNEKLKNKPFEEKKKIMAAFEGFQLEPEIAAAAEWGEEQIAARTKRLAELAYGTIWKP